MKAVETRHGLVRQLVSLVYAAEEQALVLAGDARSLEIVVQVALKARMAGHLVPLAAFLMEPEPQPLPMLEIISDPHRHRCAYPGKTVNHRSDERPVAESDPRGGLDRVPAKALLWFGRRASLFWAIHSPRGAPVTRRPIMRTMIGTNTAASTLR